MPWLHIVGEVAAEAKSRGLSKLAITGTRYTMEGRVYPQKLSEQGIEGRTPNQEERQRIDAIIFEELVRGRFLEDSRSEFCRIVQRMKNEGCDAVVLGCTEIPLLIDDTNSPLPTLDSTRILARAALREALR